MATSFMARTLVLILCVSVLCPLAALADNVAPVFPGKFQVAPSAELPGASGSLLLGEDLLSPGVAVPSDRSDLMSPVAANSRPEPCLRNENNSMPWNSCVSTAGVDLIGVAEQSQLKTAGDSLKLCFFILIILGILKYFLTSPFYAALWERVLSPLNWE